VIRAAVDDATHELHFEVSQGNSADRGASEVHPHAPGHKDQVKDIMQRKGLDAHTADKAQVSVPALDFSVILSYLQAKLLANHPSGKSRPRVMMKLDTEGAEYNVLSRLMRQDLLTVIDRVAIEWHHLQANDGSQRCKFFDCPPAHVAALNNAVRDVILTHYGQGSSSSTKVLDLDDESYTEDGKDWPGPRSLTC